jgi:Ca2+-binding EF-hand superfamily protein
MGMAGTRQYWCRTAAIAGLSLIGLIGSADLLAAQSRPAATPVVARSAMPQQVLSPLLKTPMDFLLRRLSANIALPDYLDLLHRDFHAADTDGDGEISEADDVLAVQLARATFRAMYLSDLMRADLDGDGAVTEAELRAALRHDFDSDELAEGSTAEQQIESQVRHFMAADADHDGRITFEEARNYIASDPDFQKLGAMGAGNARRLLFFRPEGQAVLTLADLDAAAEKLFRTADSDGDGTISADELKPFAHPVPLALKAATPIQPQLVRAEPAKPQPDTSAAARSTVGAACPMPRPSDAKVVLIGTGETTALSVAVRPSLWVRWKSTWCTACPMTIPAASRWSSWKLASR